MGWRCQCELCGRQRASRVATRLRATGGTCARAQPSATPAYKPLALAEPQRLAQPQLLLLAVVAVAVAAAKEPHGLVSRPIG